MATKMTFSRHPMRLVNRLDSGKAPSWLQKLDEELGCAEVIRRFKDIMDVEELTKLHKKFHTWVESNLLLATTEPEAYALAKAMRCALKRRLNVVQGQPAFA